jgi:hypothetical protein
MAVTSWLDWSIYWRPSGDVYAPWEAKYDGHVLRLRLGDFPAEMLYTLVLDDVEVLCLDSPWPDAWKRTVVLLEEDDGLDHPSLWAYVEKNGDLVIDGQDLGPSIERASGRGKREHEWKRMVSVEEIPRLLELLGAKAGSDVLDALKVWLSTREPKQLEALIEEQGFRKIF